MPRKIITDELKQEIINYYLSKPMTLSDVGHHFDLSNPTIGKILKDCPKYAKAKIFNPELNESYFNVIDTEAKAYFIGLLISDGNVFKENNGSNRQASISITLDLNDDYILTAFKNELQTNTQISNDGRGCGTIAVRSDKMAEDLIQYGIVPRKSFITFLPKNIQNDLMPHLIRGIFDGDGSIQAKLNPSTNKYLHAFSFCGSHQLMEDIANYCYTTLKLSQLPKVYDYKDRTLSEIKIQNIADMIIFGEWIYNKATIYLSRKYNTYLQFKEHYKNFNKQDNPELTN